MLCTVPPWVRILFECTSAWPVLTSFCSITTLAGSVQSTMLRGYSATRRHAPLLVACGRAFSEHNEHGRPQSCAQKFVKLGSVLVIFLGFHNAGFYFFCPRTNKSTIKYWLNFGSLCNCGYRSVVLYRWHASW